MRMFSSSVKRDIVTAVIYCHITTDFCYAKRDSRLSACAQAAQAHNTRSYIVFFFFTFMRTFSETWHGAYIILPNNRIGSRETWLSPCSIWRCSVTTAWRFEFIKVRMETQRVCWKSKFCLYFVNKIYLPCCCVVFFDVCQLLGPI